MENVNRQTEYPCSGCGACAAVCPKRAIKLEPDELGLLTARVESALCVDCGLCVRVCSRFSEAVDGTDLRETKLYAVQSANAETVKNCSSGGLAHELAMMAIREGGKAVGAVYDTETDNVVHEIAADESGVQRLDGSKYLQSDPQGAFTQAIEEARKDGGARFTVFGTPCQITGLAKVCKLTHIRERFLLVEIFCHGVPPYKLWKHQLERMRKRLGSGRFESVRFRYKKDGWHSYCIRADANGKTFYGSRERELFWHVYFENVLLGDACMTCRMRRERSLADLRIGDYWGKRYQSRSDGVSAAFACTEAGRAAMDELISMGRLVTLEPGTPEEMLRAQNMKGYSELAAHEESVAMLKNGASIRQTVKAYRRREPVKRKLKRVALRAGSLLPSGLRTRLKKARSGKIMR